MKFPFNDCNVNLSLSLPGGGVSLLTIVFVVLKVMGYIDWSWVWVFSPLWIAASVVIFVLLIIVAVGIFVARKL